MTLLITFLLLVIGLLLWYIKKRNDEEAYLISKKIETSTNLKRTMAMGLQYRFNFKNQAYEGGERESRRITDLFLKQDPYEFEDFVTKMMQKKFGGNAFTTSKIGDFGIDFEHEHDDDLYLGQVKAEKQDLDFRPIALVHSNMVKRNATGGYVITTSDFTPSAKRYAEGLDIELIDGIQLVTYWLESMNTSIHELNSEVT